MNEQKKIFIGVAWPYVNGDIHFGHLAGYLIPADIFARFHRFAGNDVMMVSGSDCHGTPTTIEADKRGLTPIDIVNEYHPKHVDLFRQLNLSFDLYTRTDNPTHKRVVQDMFVTFIEKDLLYKETSEQYYSETENRFLPDRYVEGACPHCGDTQARSDQCDNCGRLLAQGELINPISKLSKTPVIMKATEHYFFDWTKLESFLREYVAERGETWRPWVYKESVKWLDTGLKGRAVTRDLDWGVEIPADRIPADKLIAGHEHKRLYVWFEAVIGYLSASIKLGEDEDRDWKSFWYNDQAKHYYFAGKDNLVFHSLFWPGQLHSYDKGLHLPDVPAINQFLTLNNEGFSKSFGVTLDPRKIVADFGLDIVRFYLCLIMPENSDSDFTWDDFIVKTNNLVIANLGNFLFRSLKLTQNLDLTQANIDEEVRTAVTSALQEASELVANCNFKRYAERTLELSAFGNKYLSDTTPWAIKDNPVRRTEILAGALAIAIALNALLKPITPETADKLTAMFGIELPQWPTALEIFDLVKQAKISDPTPLFKKIETDPTDFNEKYK